MKTLECFHTNPMRDERIEKIAYQLYDEELPYHNFEHIRYVLHCSEEILKKCRQESIEVDESIVYYALLFHDAGYHEDHAAKGYDSKEAYSADLAERELRGSGIEENKINRVRDAIMATHVDARCNTVEDKVVRLADLSGLAADYGLFKKNTINLKKEFEIMNNTRLSWDEWKNSAIERVEMFLKEDMDITSDYYDKDGNSVFHLTTRDNLETLLADESEQLDT